MGLLQPRLAKGSKEQPLHTGPNSPPREIPGLAGTLVGALVRALAAVAAAFGFWVCGASSSELESDSDSELSAFFGGGGLTALAWGLTAFC